MRSLPLVLSALIGAITAAPSRAEDSPWLYGVHWFGPPANTTDVADMAGGKPIWVLETVMTNDGAGFWGPQGQLANLQNVASRGHTIILRIQPVWGKAFPLPEDTNPSMAAFLVQVRQTAELYRNVCHVWHLGNEMNLDFEWGGRQLQPEDYIEAAAQFSDRIHEVTSTLGPQQVLVGPLSPGVAEGPRWMSSTEYLTRMCQAIDQRNYRSKFQGFAIHAYGTPASEDVNVSLYEFERNPQGGFRHQLAIMDQNGFGSSPVYITEWNRLTGVGDGPQEAVSAQFLHRALANIHAWNQSGGHPIACACWFVYHDWGGWGQYSIRTMKSSGTQDEDLWHAFQYAAGRNYPAGYPQPDPGTWMGVR